MPSDLQPGKETLPRSAARPLTGRVRDRVRQRVPPFLRLALLSAGLFCIALWQLRPPTGLSFSDDVANLSAAAGRIFDEDSSIVAFKTFVEERAGIKQPSILDSHLRQQRLLAAAGRLGASPEHGDLVGRPSELPVASPTKGVPSKHSGLLGQKLGLFLLWPKDADTLATSAFLLQSYLASPTSEAAHLVILIRGDAATCREHSRRIQAEKMAVVDLARTHDRGLQIVCFTDTEWFEQHRDFLCSGWDCSAEDEERVVAAMAARDHGDDKDDQLRPIRGLVFDSLLPADVKWWGWIGEDVYVGNIQRMLPWDIAHNFDVVIPNGVTLDSPSPVALLSELALFQRRESTAALCLGYSSFLSVAAFLDGQRPTLSDFSDYLLSSRKASFLSFEATLTTFGAIAFARALTQSGAFTILLPPSNGVAPSAYDRSSYLRLMHAAHVAPHLLGTFSAAGEDRILAWDEPPVFPPLSPAGGDAHADGRFRNSTTWIYRLSGGGSAVARSEPRFDLPQDIVLTEWLFDTARNHKTSPHQPPPYPPSRLRKGHALVLLPDSETSSASTIRVKEVIWDDAHAAPDAPASWWESGEYESPAHVIL